MSFPRVASARPRRLTFPSIPNPDRPGSGIGGLDSNKSYTPFINPHIQHDWGFTVDHNLTSAQSLHFSHVAQQLQ